jgi:acyl-[acyl-carrier-protein] desaturase
VQLYLKFDRPAMMEQLRRVLNNFAMPVIHELADSQPRVARIRALKIFDEEMYYRDVYRPILDALGVSWSEMRGRVSKRKTMPSVT